MPYFNHHNVAETALRVGLEETAYTVDEVDGFQLVCIDVLSGDVDGREITLNYFTRSGSASTFLLFTCFFHMHIYPWLVLMLKLWCIGE